MTDINTPADVPDGWTTGEGNEIVNPRQVAGVAYGVNDETRAYIYDPTVELATITPLPQVGTGDWARRLTTLAT